MELPLILPFMIESLVWEFVDHRSVSPRERTRIYRAWTFHVARVLGGLSQPIDHKPLLCGTDPGRPDRDMNRFIDAKERNPNLRWSEFVKTPAKREKSTDPDPDLTQIFFGIRPPDGDWIGGLSISNTTIMETQEGVEASGLCLMGCPAEDSSTPYPGRWAEIYADLLGRPLPMEDRRTLTIAEYQFLSIEASRGQAPNSPTILAFVAEMEARGVRSMGGIGDPNGIQFRGRDRSLLVPRG